MLNAHERICACGCGQIINLKTDNYTIEKHAHRNRYFYGIHYTWVVTNKLNKGITAKKYKISYDSNDGIIKEHIEELAKLEFIEIIKNH
jgi:hypothetical protein